MLLPSEEIFQEDDMPTIEKIPLGTVDFSVDSMQNDLNVLSSQSSKKKLPSQTESIKTFCRIRPFNGINEIFIIKPDDDKVLQINMDKLPRNQVIQKQVNSYTFSKTFGDQSTQAEVFELTCKKLVEDLLYKKKSGLIFTYGMTNAGKTFTVTGTPISPGILPQSLSYLLANFNKVKSNSVLYCNFVEIYQEDVLDLLSNDPLGKNRFFKKKINVKENNRNIFYLSDATYLQLDTIEEFNIILNKGIAKKAHSSTNLNQNSSRSHTIFKIILREKDMIYDDPNIIDISLSIVDLAGSERANRTETSGKELQEACKINQSLSILGKCLEAMKHNSIYTQKKMVPFRESKLTKLFCEYFQGEQNIIMVTNINPRKEDFEETLRALNYSCIAKEIKPIKSRIINNNSVMRKIVKVNHGNINDKARIRNEYHSSSSSSSFLPLSNSSTNCLSETNDNNDLVSNGSNSNNALLTLHESVSSNDTISNLIFEIQKLRSEVNNMKSVPSNEKEPNSHLLSSSSSTSMNYNDNSKTNCNQLLLHPYEQMIPQMMPYQANDYNNQTQIPRGIMGGLPMQKMPGVNLFFINSKFNDFHLSKAGLIPEENESEEDDGNNNNNEAEDEYDEMKYERKRNRKGGNKKLKPIPKRNKSMPEKKARNQLEKGNNKQRKVKKKRNNKKDKEEIVCTPEKRIFVPQAYEETEIFNSKIELGQQDCDRKIYHNNQNDSPPKSNYINENEDNDTKCIIRNIRKKKNIDIMKQNDNLNNTKSEFFFRTQAKGRFSFLNGF